MKLIRYNPSRFDILTVVHFDTYFRFNRCFWCVLFFSFLFFSFQLWDNTCISSCEHCNKQFKYRYTYLMCAGRSKHFCNKKPSKIKKIESRRRHDWFMLWRCDFAILQTSFCHFITHTSGCGQINRLWNLWFWISGFCFNTHTTVCIETTWVVLNRLHVCNETT